MANLAGMPPIEISAAELKPWGKIWLKTDPEKTGDRANYFVKKDAMALPHLFDRKVAEALAIFLGGIPVTDQNTGRICSPTTDCVELGGRVVGAIRPQNFDACYRPDGVRFAFDSKGLNDASSVQKNYQNMLNDLGTEAATVHIRFPYAVVGFIVVIPEPALVSPQREALSSALIRLSRRVNPNEDPHRAEAISLVIWDPKTGKVSSDWPVKDSSLRIERFSEFVEKAYLDRYAGMPPHD